MAALLLRVITKARWIRPDWMGAEDIPADALSDLKASGNALSVWHVEDDSPSLELVIQALAAKRESLDKLDYMLIEYNLMPGLNIKVEQADGTTPHLSANPLHRSLVQLTVRQLAQLAENMIKLEKRRIPENQIKRLLVEGVTSGVLDCARMHEKLLKSLAPHLNR